MPKRKHRDTRKVLSRSPPLAFSQARPRDKSASQRAARHSAHRSSRNRCAIPAASSAQSPQNPRRHLSPPCGKDFQTAAPYEPGNIQPDGIAAYYSRRTTTIITLSSYKQNATEPRTKSTGYSRLKNQKRSAVRSPSSSYAHRSRPYSQ